MDEVVGGVVLLAVVPEVSHVAGDLELRGHHCEVGGVRSVVGIKIRR